jgi:phage terminase small subunit
VSTKTQNGDGPGRGTPTQRERRFAEEYARDANGVAAYFRAFGRVKRNGRMRSYKAAQVQASRLLEKPIIAAEIAAARRDLARRSRVSALRVLRELAAIAFFDPIDVFKDDPDTGLPVPRPWAEVSPAARRAIASVRVKRRRIRVETRGDVEIVEEVEEVEYRFNSKLEALDKLARHLGLTRNGAALEQLLALLAEEQASKATS